MRKKDKYDFLEINRAMNDNFNGSSFMGYGTLNITNGEECKINRKIQERYCGKKMIVNKRKNKNK